jgi:hypothetical protein
MEKKRSSQPILNDDQRESSTKDLDSQVSGTHKMPGSDKQAKQKGKGKSDMKGNKDKQW